MKDKLTPQTPERGDILMYNDPNGCWELVRCERVPVHPQAVDMFVKHEKYGYVWRPIKNLYTLDQYEELGAIDGRVKGAGY